MQQLLDKWERLRKSEYLRPDEKLMLNHCISDLKRFMDHGVDVTEMVGNRTAVDGWFNIYLVNGEIVIGSVIGFKTEKEAKSRRVLNDTYIKTIKINNETYGGNNGNTK